MLPNSRGGYSFLKGISPYSGGVAAAKGFAIEHVRLSRVVPWKAGFERIDAHLRAAGRPRQALCAIALRSPKPFSFGGWNESKFGVGDITGRGSIEFWTQSKKMTTKWNREAGTNWMS